MANRRHPSSRATDGHDDDIRDVNEPVDNAKRTAALSRLLDEAWDPLERRKRPLSERPASGWYAAYVPALLALLDRGATRAEVAWHLRNVEHAELKLSPTGDEIAIADLILRWHTLWSS